MSQLGRRIKKKQHFKNTEYYKRYCFLLFFLFEYVALHYKNE
ncbi:unnamed protein product [Tenebrio molitor]|nr:unnamed protein product [Tenebrio molitor]